MPYRWLTLGLLILCPAAFSPAAAVERPNILIVLVDDMGYSDLGCYGSEIRTPHLDRLAKAGVRYTQMYNTSKCWTTRISLLTGIYHRRSGRHFEHTATVGEVLRPAGYHTWWSGKHHASFNAHDRGFDHFHGFIGGAINFWNPGDKAREGEPVPGWRATYSWAFDEKLVKPFIPDKSFYATDAFTDWALTWLKVREADKAQKDWPFFLYVAYNAPHWPLHAHPEDIGKYKGVYDVGYDAIRAARYERQIELGLFEAQVAPLSERTYAADAWQTLTDEQRHDESMRMAIHAAMVDRVDQNIGRLVAQLDKSGELDNTLIMFMVDNGASAERPNAKGAPKEPWGSVGTFEAIGRNWANVADTPLRLWKATSHEGGINTPMIAYWPKGIAESMRGRFYREPCHLIDLLPTWMQLAGSTAKYPGVSKETDIPAIDGVSLLPTFAGNSLTREKPLFFEFGSGKAVRDGAWKLVRNRTNAWELYNLASDRTETNDLAAVEPDRAERMEQAWHAWYRDCTGKTWADPGKKQKTRKK